MADEFEGEGLLQDGDTPLASEEVLTNEEANEFVEAIQLGAASGVADILGHEVEYTLLNIQQELEVARIISDFDNTAGRNRAYKTAVVAAAVDKIDGEYIYVPASPEQARKIIRHKFDTMSKYYALFVDKIYEDVIKKEMETGQNLVNKLSKSEG